MSSPQGGTVGVADKKIDPFVFLFSITLLLSATLTFTVQPMIGKMLLPLVGGSPSGWLVTMTYFQLALLAGYTIAHLLSYISVLKHMLVVIGLLFVGVLAFPLQLQNHIIENSGLPEVFAVLLALFFSLTIPCVALFTLSPSLQRLFEAGSSRTSRDPYFLFAASNIGSLGGLLAYPLEIERVSGLSAQAHLWQFAYTLLIVLCLFCILFAWKQARAAHPVEATSLVTVPAISWKTRGRWTLLAFIPSSLMLGVTSYITTDTGAVPFFWVMPLALYLLTFILAFAQKQYISRSTIDFLQTASVGVLMAVFIKAPAIVSAPEDMIFPLMVFFLSALFCHFTLAAERPNAKKLTEFYLWVAIGGALGGSFNTFIAPFIFPLPIEFMLVVLLSCLIHPERAIVKTVKMQRIISLASVIAVALAVVCASGILRKFVSVVPQNFAFVILIFAMIALSISPRMLIGLSLVFGGFAVSANYAHMLDVHRDFYGVSRIFEEQKHDTGMAIRTFYHGSTLHGQEEIAPKLDTTPNSYYDTDGPLGDLMTFFHPAEVGIVGMGAGTTLCYQAPGRHYTVYELNPIVPVFAEKWFDYVHACGTPDIHIGDGRRMLAADNAAQYDLLTLDAFTSDAIPLHLLTVEAFKIYMNRLKPNGILAIHISNRFYNLRPPISNIAFALGMHALYRTYEPLSDKPLASASRWVAIARVEAELEPLRKRDWQNLPPPRGLPWTDDFSNALSALDILQPETEVTHVQTH